MEAGAWVPAWVRSKEGPTPPKAFTFELACELNVSGSVWSVEYRLALTPFRMDRLKTKDGAEIPVLQTMKIDEEYLAAKEMGRPGPKKTLIERNSGGETIVSHLDSRSQVSFVSQDDLSVLKIIETREPKDFQEKFPLIASFRNALLVTDLMRLNASKLIESSQPNAATAAARVAGGTVDHFSLYGLLDSIKHDESRWREFKGWMKILCDITDISLFELKMPQAIAGAKASPDMVPWRFVFLTQHGRSLLPAQLSTGHAMLLGIATALYTFMDHNGAILLEEPESYLHPRAIIDLVKLLREKSSETSILISTHSPVLLNDLRPEEVSLMQSGESEGYFTTQPVSEIKDAVAALHRGVLSFGDLLQSNFTTKDD